MTRRHLILMMSGGGLALAQKPVGDGAIYDQIKMRLANDPDVKGGTLDVDVKAGAVTLSGRLSTEKAKVKAEKLAKKVRGVTTVTNQIRVEP